MKNKNKFQTLRQAQGQPTLRQAYSEPNRTARNQKGFTLLETVVALGILALGIGRTFVSLQDIEMNFGYAKGYIVAAYLNQEAIEYLRNIKDSNVYEPVPANETYDSGIIYNNPDYYEIDIAAQEDSQLISLSNNSEIENQCFSSGFNTKNCYELTAIKDLNIRSSAPYYFYGGANDMKANMKRIVKVEKVSGNDGANDYETIKAESIVLFKVKEKVYAHKVIHFMYDR